MLSKSKGLKTEKENLTQFLLNNIIYFHIRSVENIKKIQNTSFVNRIKTDTLKQKCTLF